MDPVLVGDTLPILIAHPASGRDTVELLSYMTERNKKGTKHHAEGRLRSLKKRRVEGAREEGAWSQYLISIEINTHTHTHTHTRVSHRALRREARGEWGEGKYRVHTSSGA